MWNQGEVHTLVRSHSTPSPCWKDAQKEDGEDTARHWPLCHSQLSQGQQTTASFVTPPTIRGSIGWFASAESLSLEQDVARAWIPSSSCTWIG